MNIVDAAMLIAIDAHAGDRNKHDGEMYLLHVARVVMNVRDAGGTEIQQAIAWLHDVVEDTPLTTTDLLNLLCEMTNSWLPQDSQWGSIQMVVTAVDALTKHKGEELESYYQRVRMFPDARFVKYQGDMKDNFRRNHKITDPEVKARMGHKYSLGMDMLG